jgi:histidine ammonia-lyase
VSLEALKANMKPYTPKLHEAREFPGEMRTAKAIQKAIIGEDLAEGKLKVKVQDSYSMRSTPQVVGAAHDAIAWAREQVEIELNGVGENPVFSPKKTSSFRVPISRDLHSPCRWIWWVRPSPW